MDCLLLLDLSFQPAENYFNICFAVVDFQTEGKSLPVKVQNFLKMRLRRRERKKVETRIQAKSGGGREERRRSKWEGNDEGTLK